MALLDREREVLTTIIEAYIGTASPVGSRAVSKQSPLGLSPASIRNIMGATVLPSETHPRIRDARSNAPQYPA